MKKYTSIVSIAVLLAALFIQPAFARRIAPDGPVELEGILDGAAYVIRVPADWNGTLLVFAHGYDFGTG